MKLLIFAVITCTTAFGQATNLGWNSAYVGTGNGAKAGGTTYYVDYVSGSNANNGTAKGTAWKSAPGMNCTPPSHTYLKTDQIIFKGGVTWPAVCFPWAISAGGTATPNGSGYPGLYIGYDPTWNAGIVNSVRVIDPGSCAAGTTFSVAFSGGGGTSAAATAAVASDTYAAGDLGFVTVTNAGSGYTFNPTVTLTVTGGSCATMPTVLADIYSPVMDGSGTTYGNSSGISPMMTFSVDYGTVDHLEFKNYLWYVGTYSGGSPTMLGWWNNNQEFRNNYIHNFGPVGDATGTTYSTFLVGALNAAQTAATQGAGSGSMTGTANIGFTNNILNNYEKTVAGGCVSGNGNSGQCVYNTAVYGQQYATNNVVAYWRAGFYTSSDATGTTAPYMVAGNKVWGILSDANTQHADSLYLLGSTIAYNNILRDIYPGAAAFYTETMNGSAAGMTSYIFNNVMFGIGTFGAGTSTPPIGWTSEFAPGSGSTNPVPDLRAYNNTFYSNVGNTNCMNAGQWFGGSASMTVVFTIKNNYCVSSQASGHWIASGGNGTWNGIAGSSGSFNTTLDPTAVIQSPATASSAGYVAANNYAPTSSSSATVTFASGGGTVNLTSLCGTSIGGVSLANLCYDIQGNARPSSGGWQAGAYQFGASAPGSDASIGAILLGVKIQ